MKKLRIILSAALAVAAVAAEAAVPLAYPGSIVAGAALPGGVQMAAADFNGDKLPDLAVADGANSSTSPQAGGVWVYFATAGGGYAKPVFTATASFPVAIATGDLDADGDADIVTGNASAADTDAVASKLINAGDGTFTLQGSVTGPALMASVAAADIDGDGKADLVAGGDNGAILLELSGSGTIRLFNTSNDNISGVAVADLDSDGDADIVAASGSCWMTAPSGAVDVFEGPFSGTSINPTYSVAADNCKAIVVDDVDEDGRPDVVAAGGGSDAVVQLLINQSGSLSGPPISVYTLPSGTNPNAIRATDLDGDGHTDLLVPGGDSVSVLYGTGDGSFDGVVSVPIGSEMRDVAAADTDADGRPDLVALDQTYIPPYSGFLSSARNLGGRHFLSYRDYPYQNAILKGKQVYDMAGADFNGDGYPDVVTANKGDGTLSLLLNDGDGGFSKPAVITVPALGPTAVLSVAAGDVDGDGKADVVTGDNAGLLLVALGNGDGSFKPFQSSALAAASPVRGLAFGDLDDDGSPDIVAATYTANLLQKCQNLGGASFNCTAGLSVSKPNDVTLADLNGDSNPEIIATTTESFGSGESAAWVFDGDSGTSRQLAVRGYGDGVATGDLNGDGKVDLAFGAYGTNQLSVYLANADGTYGAAPVLYSAGLTDLSAPKQVALLRVNGDGRPDLVVPNPAGGTLAVLMNNGDGTFKPPVHHVMGRISKPALVLDMDGDGLDDIVVANKGDWPATSTVSVYLHNHAPALEAATLTVVENASGAGTLAATDAERDALTFAVASSPAHGKAVLQQDGHFTYTPARDYHGSDQFTATASDGLNTSRPVTVAITVEAQLAQGDDDTPPPADSGNGTSPPASGSGGGGGWGFIGGLLMLAALSRRRGLEHEFDPRGNHHG